MKQGEDFFFRAKTPNFLFIGKTDQMYLSESKILQYFGTGSFATRTRIVKNIFKKTPRKEEPLQYIFVVYDNKLLFRPKLKKN